MVFIQKRGRIYYIYWHENKKTHGRSCGTTNKKLAELIRRQKEDDLSTNKFQLELDREILLSDFETIALQYSNNNKSQRTHELEKIALKHFIKFVGNVQLHQINAQHIENFKTGLLKCLSPVTVNIYLRHLSAVFSLAVRYDYLKNNPFKKVPLLPVDKKLPIYITKDQAEIILNALKPYRVHLPVMIALYTGARISEVCDLEWKSVDLENGKIRLFGKGKKERQVPIPKVLIDHLRTLERNQYVLVGSRNRKKITRKFREYVDRIDDLDLKHFTFHNLRDTYASWLCQAGVSLQVIQKLLGHESIKTTMIYAHLAPESFNGIAEKLE